MAGLGKKILSAFVEIKPADEKKTTGDDAPVAQTGEVPTSKVVGVAASSAPRVPAVGRDKRFEEYFDKLFAEANIPGPDYYEFSRMVVAMQAIGDERARYFAAFAGLQVQGLDKAKLLATAGQYLQVLEADAGNFQGTINAALESKVNDKKKEMTDKAQRIQDLAKEMSELQNQIASLQQEVKENEDKILASRQGYTDELEERKAAIRGDMEKIGRYIS